MEEFYELSSHEYHKVIEAMTEQIQQLTVELASVLCDVSRYLSEEEREVLRNLDPEDFTCRLQINDWYQLYVEYGLDGYNPLTDEVYLDEVTSYLSDDDADLCYPSYYSRKKLRGVQ